MSCRVRYAPSPTGKQHIGGIRTALMNYLFAKSRGGAFIVRVEDTDQKRSKIEYQNDLFESLEWLGLQADESKNVGPFAPYIQSERYDMYREYALKLIEDGNAYYCFKTPKTEIDTHKDKTVNEFSAQGSKNLREVEQQGINKDGIKPVIRLKLPLEGHIEFEDELLGTISRRVDDIIEDPILLKSDGFPTYHLANVIDDHLMEISHVIRSQEWIPTTPVHVYLYKLFNWTAPRYLHLPMVLGEDGQKLSKRNGSLSIQELKHMGVLPQALINCIALLGWSFDDSREFFSKIELIQLFSEGKLHKSSAMFSMEKLKWFNAHYIRSLSQEDLAAEILVYIKEQNWECSHELALKLVPLIQERLSLLSDCTHILKPIFEDINHWDIESLLKKHSVEIILMGLDFALEILINHSDTSAEELEILIRKKLEDENNSLKLGQVLMPLRVAVTGSLISPPILPLIKCMNLEKIQDRIINFKKFLEINEGKNE